MVSGSSSLARATARITLATLLALGAASCRDRGDITGSITQPAAGAAAGLKNEQQRTAERQHALAAAAERYRKRPDVKANALTYASLLRAAGQSETSVGIMQQAALKHQNDPEVRIAYGKALADAGQLQDALKVLEGAEQASQADWQFFSTRGAVLDQLGQHLAARADYKTALALAPEEPKILSNLGLSYALTRELEEAEAVLRRAAAHPAADVRVRENLALVYGLQGRFEQAEALLRQHLPPEEATANARYMRTMLSESDRWKAIEAGGSAG